MVSSGPDVEYVLGAKDTTRGAFRSVNKGLRQLGKVALAAGALTGVAVAGIGVAAVKMAADFENGMREVNTLINLPQTGLNELSKDTLALSSQLGIVASEVVPALYQAISAGVPQDNVMSFLEIAGKAAIGGVTTIETAVDGLTSVVNAYGSEVLSVGQAADIMFTTVKGGKTNFEELASSLFNVIPTAASLGISFEEVGAALATITAQGTPTRVATTGLRQLFIEASKSGSKLNDAILDLTGQGFSEMISEGSTAQAVLQRLRLAAKEADIPFGDLFGSVEALQSAMQITGGQADRFAQELFNAQNSAGAAEAAFAEMEKGLTRAWERIKVKVQNGLITLGLQVLPQLAGALDKLSPVVDRAFGAFQTAVPIAIDALRPFGEKVREIAGDLASRLPGALDVVRGAFAELGAAVEPLARTVLTFVVEQFQKLAAAAGPLASALQSKLSPALSAFVGFFRDNREFLVGAVAVIGILLVGAFISLGVSAAGAAIGVLAALAPILLIVAAGALLIGGLILLVKNWDAILERFPIIKSIGLAVVGVFNTLRSKFEGFVSAVVSGVQSFDVFGKLGAIFSKIGDVVGELAAKFMNDFLPAMQTIGVVLLGLIQLALIPFQAAWAFLSTFIAGVWDEIVGVLSAALSFIVQIIENQLELMRDIFSVVLAVLRGDWAGAWEGIKTLLSNVLENIVETFKTLLPLLLAVGKLLWAGIHALWDASLAGLFALISGVLNFIVDLFGGLLSLILGALGDLGSFLKDAGADLIGGLIGGITGKIGDLKDTITGIPGKVKGWLTGGFGIFSPSKMFAEIGENLIEGLNAGVSATLPSLQTMVDQIVAMMAQAQAPSLAQAAVAPAFGGSFGSVNQLNDPFSGGGRGDINIDTIIIGPEATVDQIGPGTIREGLLEAKREGFEEFV